jgi:REP element-mobilizing transposase RayT
MTNYIHKRHNVNMMLYHVVCPTKFRKVVIDQQVDRILVETCIQIQNRYDIHFVEIGTDLNHVHFLIQSVPMMLPTRIVQTVKSITAREIFRQLPSLKKTMWGSSFWSTGYYIATVGKHGNEKVIARYVREQGVQNEYQQLHRNQLSLFD